MGHQSKARCYRNHLEKVAPIPKILLWMSCDGQFGSTNHNWLTPKSYLAVVAKEDVEDNEDEAVHRLRNSFL